MSLRSVFRFTDEAQVEGRTVSVDELRLRRARVAAARRVTVWTEIPDDLVERPRCLVSAETDAVYVPARGAIFEPRSATPLASHAPLHYTVSDEDVLRFYERQPLTWSQVVERRERQKARR